MNSNQINTNIAEAFDILLSKRLSQLSYDQTIQAEINEIVNKDEGHYKIKYQSAIFDAYSENTETSYKVGQSVYVKVPKNDFSQKLLIESRVGDETLTENQRNNLKNHKIAIEPKFTYDIYFSLVAGVEDTPQKEELLYTGIDENFLELSNQYEVICLEAIFKNQLIDFYSSGNYGLRFTFLDVNDQKVTYTLDTNNFVGNFYKANKNGNKQKTFYLVPKGTLKAIYSISFFQEGLHLDRDLNNPQLDNSGNVTNNYPIITIPNLWAEKPTISFYEVVDLLSEEELLFLEVPRGYVGEDLPFTAHLLQKGEEVLSNEYSIFWYKRSVNTQSKNKLGINWEILNEVSSKTITLSGTEGIREVYKVVIYKDEELITEKEFEISGTILEPMPKIGQSIKEEEVELFLPKGYVADWYNGNNTLIKEKVNSIILTNTEPEKITVNNIQSEDGQRYGVIETIASTPSFKNRTIIKTSGKTCYCYDTFGYQFPEVVGKEKELIIGISTQKPIEEKRLTISGDLISKDKEKPYSAKESQLKDMYWEELESGALKLHYFLEKNLQKANKNNTVTLEIKYKNGQEEEFKIPFYFFSLGELGTKDGKSVCFLEAVGNSYVSSKSPLKLALKVFENGVELTQKKDIKIITLALYCGDEIKDLSNNVTANNEIIIDVNDINKETFNYILFKAFVDGETLTTLYPIAQKLTSTQSTYRFNLDGTSLDDIDATYDFSKDTSDQGYYLTGDEKKPEIYYLDLLGNETLNTWQQDKSVDLISKQIMAGIKSENVMSLPLFSGIIMGKNDNLKDNSNLGVYGYNNSKEVYSITEKGVKYGNTVLDKEGLKVLNFEQIKDTTNNKTLSKALEELNSLISKLEGRVSDLESAVSNLNARIAALEAEKGS